MTVNAELNIPTFDELDAASLNLVHSEFETEDQLLVSQVEGSGDVNNSPIDLTTLVREQLHDLFCRQIQEQLNTGQGLPFQFSEDRIL